MDAMKILQRLVTQLCVCGLCGTLLQFSAVFFLVAPGVASSYSQDTHYHMRFGLALSTCFDWDEAHLIASADIGMDENSTVSAEMNPIGTRNKADWHAFGHSDKRYRELWLRASSEPDLERRLIKLGQFMHFAEDWESHAGYGVRMGHARDTYAGRDPDSLGSNPAKNHRMIQSSIDHLLATCADLGRLSEDPDVTLVELMLRIYDTNLLEELYQASSPSWKRGKLGCRAVCQQIETANKERIEQVIMDRVKSRPEKHVPADFAPGPDTGFPDSLTIPFDPSGAVLTTVSIREAMQSWAAASERSPDIVLELTDAQINYRRSRANELPGWRVTIIASNVGEIESAAGQIEVVVIDSDDERVLAQSSEALPVLAPGESREFQTYLPADERPEPDAIISAFARVGDLTADNDADWLMLGDAELERADLTIVTDLDPQGEDPETVRFLDDPKMTIVDNRACLLVTAQTSWGDSSEKLEPVVFEIVGGTESIYYFYPTYPGRWSAFSTENGLVAAKTFECFVPGLLTYQRLSAADPATLRLAVTVQTKDTDPYIEEFPFDPAFMRSLLEIARQTSERGEVGPRELEPL
jgi:hypothetical protein